jgi:Na+-driven multidrug efflux pump
LKKLSWLTGVECCCKDLSPRLFRLAIPIISGDAFQSGYRLTDAFWVGRLGAPAVAAVAVSFPVTFLVIALGAGLAMAGAILSAQYMGAGRQDMVNHETWRCALNSLW